MGRGKTWMGPRGAETWVPTFAINPDYARTGYSSETPGLQGGVFVRNSKNAVNSYTLAWNPTKTRDAIRPITDMAEGVFDEHDGANLIYWIDPMAADKNVAPMSLGFPAQACEDARELLVGIADRRPKAVPTPANTLRYPRRSARYTLRPDSESRRIYFPIPPGHTAWIGVHGDTAAQGHFLVQGQYGGSPAGDPVAPVILSVNDPIRVNTSFASGTYTGIEVYLGGTVAEPTPFVLSGVMIQMLPTGRTPETGGYISGQGHSGCEFAGKPAKTPYSSALDRVGMTARLVETGDYLS